MDIINRSDRIRLKVENALMAVVGPMPVQSVRPLTGHSQGSRLTDARGTGGQHRTEFN